MYSCFTLAHVYRLTGDWAWLWRSVLMFDSFMLPAPSSTYCSLLRPRRAIEEVGRRSLARAHSLSPGWIFRGLLIPSAGAIGCLPASLFLAALANWNLISWAPAFSRFCQLDRRIPPPPPGQDGVDSEDPTGAIRDLCSGSRFGVKLVVLHRVTVLIARGISMLNSVCFPTPWELVTYPLLEVWNSPGEDTYCSSFRIIGTWNRLLLHHKTPSHPRVLSGHPSASRAALSRGVSVWLLCLRLFFFFWSCVPTNL